MGILKNWTSKRAEDKAKAAEGSLKKEIADSASEPVKEKAVAKKAPSKRVASEFLDIVRSPHITEKSAHLAAESRYLFDVAPYATRTQVRQAIKAIYDVTPERVNIMHVRGKSVRVGKRQGTRVAWKKAIVMLSKGSTIDVYKGV